MEEKEIEKILKDVTEREKKERKGGKEKRKGKRLRKFKR